RHDIGAGFQVLKNKAAASVGRGSGSIRTADRARGQHTADNARDDSASSCWTVRHPGHGNLSSRHRLTFRRAGHNTLNRAGVLKKEEQQSRVQDRYRHGYLALCKGDLSNSISKDVVVFNQRSALADTAIWTILLPHRYEFFGNDNDNAQGCSKLRYRRML